MTNPALAAVTIQNLPAPNKNTLQLLLETFHRLSGNAVSLCYKDLPTSTTMAAMQLLNCATHVGCSLRHLMLYLMAGPQQCWSLCCLVPGGARDALTSRSAS